MRACYALARRSPASVLLLCLAVVSCVSFSDPSKAHETANAVTGEDTSKYHFVQSAPLWFRRDVGPLLTHPSYYNFTECSCVGVVSTILAHSTAISRAVEAGLCVIVVADTNTPRAWERVRHPRLHFMSLDTQSMLFPQLHKATPLRSITRKNFGYLTANRYGARCIFDFDDDNVPVELPVASLRKRARCVCASSNSLSPVVNPLSRFLHSSNSTAIHVWPRGFLLQFAAPRFTRSQTYKSCWCVPFIIQCIAQYNPDVDAVFRLTHDLPIQFANSRLTRPSEHQVSPYNAQATLHSKDAFPLLFLPSTVNGRVSDIWRGYIAQAILSMCKVEGCVSYSSPCVKHVRNPHDLMRDFNAEEQLYSRTAALLDLLYNLEQAAPAFDTQSCMLTQLHLVYRALYEHGFLGLRDLALAMHWESALVMSRM